MAGTRKRQQHAEILFFLVLMYMTRTVNCVTCLSQKNEQVDWFIGYKLPGSEKTVPKNSFFYMDAKSPSWTLSSRTLDQNGQAIYNTLEQIYKTSQAAASYSEADDLLYMMYNDEIPKAWQRARFYGSSHGHTKGVIAFDSKSGFWLVHSTPQFPPPQSAGYKWPDSAETYGQSFLCVSMETDLNLETIGQQFWFNYPGFYDKIVPQSFKSKYPNITSASEGKHVTGEPWCRETKLTSLAGISFLSFAKNADFDKDLYSDLLVPRFQSTLLVETWQNGREKMCSNCTSKYQVFNIENLAFKEHSVMFKETQDHSKWAITNTTSSASIWTCIGDINRQVSQMKRPGGTVCFQNKYVWQSFHDLITSYHNCGPYKECIPP